MKHPRGVDSLESILLAVLLFSAFVHGGCAHTRPADSTPVIRNATLELKSSTGSSSVTVYIEASTGKPLRGIGVSLERTTLGALTDKEGRATILDVPPGVYTAIVGRIDSQYRILRLGNVAVVSGYDTNLGRVRLSKSHLKLEPREVL